MRRLVFALSVLLALTPAARAAIDSSAEHALLMDAESGQVLWHKNGMVPMPPASMSKLMTLDILFQRLKDGRLKLTDTFAVSERAWRTQGSKMFVELGSRISVENLIRGIIIVSGNDACVVVAEGIGGTVENFAAMMNARAKELGLNQSRFVNPDGLPEPPGQMMSALDLARLARHLITAYPQYYPYFSEREFTWHKIKQPNRDLALGKLEGADGLKTGHTDAAGYGITLSARRGNQRLILVLNGLRYPQYSNSYFPNIRRAEEAGRVMDLAFREFRRYPVFAANQAIGEAPVIDGAGRTVPVTAGQPLAVTMMVDSRAGMRTALRFDPNLTAPIAQGQRIGTVTVSAPNFPGLTVPVHAARAVPRANIAVRLWRRALGMAGVVTPGRFITLEGGEGAGKSTQLRRLAAQLEAQGRQVVATREPGGSPGAEQIRKLVVEGDGGRWNPITETLLVYAARADHVARTIGPALARGDWVISDRFNDSTYAYQGAGRGVERETIRRIDAAVLDDFKPDLTLILDLPVEVGLARAGARGGVENRFEGFDRDFHERMRKAFQDIAKRQPDRCRLIDATGTQDDVAAAIWDAVKARFDL